MVETRRTSCSSSKHQRSSSPPPSKRSKSDPSVRSDDAEPSTADPGVAPCDEGLAEFNTDILVPARLGSSDFDMTVAAYKAGTSGAAGLAVPAIRCKVFKEGLQDKILDSDDVKVSWENFPYHLRDWNGSKRGHVYKFLRSQGFVSSYDTAYQYSDSDADAHKWVSHRNHRGNICGVDFIWLLNPNRHRKPLKSKLEPCCLCYDQGLTSFHLCSCLRLSLSSRFLPLVLIG